LILSEDWSLPDNEIILGAPFIFSLEWVFGDGRVSICQKLEKSTGRSNIVFFQNQGLNIPSPIARLPAEVDHKPRHSARPHIIGVCLGTVVALTGGFMFWIKFRETRALSAA
jgi:hypothetical protein